MCFVMELFSYLLGLENNDLQLSSALHVVLGAPYIKASK